MYSVPHFPVRLGLLVLLFLSFISLDLKAQAKITSIQVVAFVTAGEAQDEVNRL